MTIEVKESLKVVNRYDSNVVLHDSKNYPEFSGNVWNDFVLFLVNKKANLSKANLSKADLSNANLSNANLYNANLSNANLYNANLSNANLYTANLFEANLSNANLSNANLYNANLYNANLSKADLLNSARDKIKGINCLEFNFNTCFSFILMKNDKTSQLQIGCKILSIAEWKEEFNSKNNYIDDCNDEDHYNLHKDKFFKYLPLFEEFLKDN